MAQFDLYILESSGALVIDVQSDLIDNFDSRVVIPLIQRSSSPTKIARLHPEIWHDRKPYTLATHLMSAVPLKLLGEPRGNLEAERGRIVAAIDVLVTGI